MLDSSVIDSIMHLRTSLWVYGQVWYFDFLGQPNRFTYLAQLQIPNKLMETNREPYFFVHEAQSQRFPREPDNQV